MADISKITVGGVTYDVKDETARKTSVYIGPDQPTDGTMYWLDTSVEEPDVPVVPDEPDVPVDPEVTLTSISATYSGGDVAVGTALTDLTGIVVTATYSDGSTATVTGYTLSGEIAEGSNTITVTYEGKIATFTVTGVAEEEDATWETLSMTYGALAGAYQGGKVYSDTGTTEIGTTARGAYSSEVFSADTEISVTVSVSGLTSYVGYGVVVPNSVFNVYNAVSIAGGKTETVEMTIPSGNSLIVCGNYSQHYTVEAKKKVVAGEPDVPSGPVVYSIPDVAVEYKEGYVIGTAEQYNAHSTDSCYKVAGVKTGDVLVGIQHNTVDFGIGKVGEEAAVKLTGTKDFHDNYSWCTVTWTADKDYDFVWINVRTEYVAAHIDAFTWTTTR